MPNQKEVRLREFAGLLSRRIDELKQPPPGAGSLKEAFRAFADTLPTIVWTARSDGEVTFFSKKWYDLLRQGETPWAELVHPADVQRTTEAWRAAVESGTPFAIASRLRDVDGNYHALISHANPVRDEAGKVAYWIGSAVEVEDSAVSLMRVA